MKFFLSKVWLGFATKTLEGKHALKQVTFNVYLVRLFTMSLVIHTDSRGFAKFRITSIRPSTGSYYDITTGEWGPTPNKNLVLSFPWMLTSVRPHNSVFFQRIPRLDAFPGFNIGGLRSSLENFETIQGSSEIDILIYLPNERRFVPWSEGSADLAALHSLGIAVNPWRGYQKKRRLPGSSIAEPAALVFKQDTVGRTYAISVLKKDLPSIVNVLPAFAYEPGDKSSPFFSPRLQGMFTGVCTEATVTLLDDFLLESVTRLMPLLIQGKPSAESLLCQENATLQQFLRDTALSLNFELLSLFGFLPPRELKHLQSVCREKLGVSIQPSVLPDTPVDLSKEILVVKALLEAFLPQLVANLSTKQKQSLRLTKNRDQVIDAVASLICRTVWFTWQRYIKDPTAFRP
jgi:hypothetical protein